MSSDSQRAIMAAIDGAQEVQDPLVALVERAAEDAGAPFEPDMVRLLADLKRSDPAGYESIRAKLKTALVKSGGRISVLEDAIAGINGESASKAPSQVDILLELAEEARLFHSPSGTAYADLKVAGHRETWRVDSRGFRSWLLKQYYDRTVGAPNGEALKSALGVLEARAQYDGPEHEVHVRVASLDGAVYLDLADPQWRVVKITSTGYRVVPEPPVRFRRSDGMQPLPEPLPGGKVDLLREHLNIKTDNDFVLAVSWLLAALHPDGPYPVLVLSGEQGTAKSTFSKMLRSLVDPYLAPVRGLPRDNRDLYVAANSSHVQAFDNVSGLQPAISDTLCCLSTGGGLALRQLYTDQDEVIFEAMRPIILNGITDVVTRSDLADRAIFLVLEAIPEERRVAEKDLWAIFEEEKPQILGALLDAFSTGLRLLPEVKLDYLPRMADFAKWATACEPALWEHGAFLAAYANNREEVMVNVLDNDSVAAAISALMDQRDGAAWEGTATELLEALAGVAGDKVTRNKAWPSTPTALSNRVTRAATFLRKLGIEIKRERVGKERRRTISISSNKTGDGCLSPSASSAASAATQEVPSGGGLPFSVADAGRTMNSPSPEFSVRPNHLKSLGVDQADAADDEVGPAGAGEKGGETPWTMTI